MLIYVMFIEIDMQIKMCKSFYNISIMDKHYVNEYQKYVHLDKYADINADKYVKKHIVMRKIHRNM